MMQHPPPISELPPYCVGMLKSYPSDLENPVLKPTLSYPPGLLSVDPDWSECEFGFFGAYDPPRTLERASAMATVDTGFTTSTPASPGSLIPQASVPAKPTPDPEVQSITLAKPDKPKQSAAPVAEADPLAEADPETTVDPLNRHDSQQQDPRISGSDPPSKDSSDGIATHADQNGPRPKYTLPSLAPNEEVSDPQTEQEALKSTATKQDLGIGAYIANAMGLIPDTPAKTITDPSKATTHDAIPPKPTVYTVSLASDLANIIANSRTSTLPAPTHSDPVISLADDTLTLHLPLSSPYMIANQGLEPGGPSITISGTPVALAAGASQMVVGSSTVNLFPTHASQPAPLLTIGHAVASPASDRASAYVIGGQTLLPGHPAITISLSPAVAALTSSPDSNEVSPASFTIADTVVVIANPSSILVAGTTILPGSNGINVAGTLVSLAATGGSMFLGTQVIPLSRRPATPLTAGPGETVSTPNPTVVNGNGTAVSANAPGVVTSDSKVVSSQASGSSSLVDGSTTAVPSGNGNIPSKGTVFKGEASRRRGVNLRLWGLYAVDIAICLSGIAWI